MTLRQIRNRVRVLQRKFALELTVIRLRPYATEFCQQWAVAKANQQPLSKPHPFIIKLADAGFRFPNFIDLHDYIKRKEDHDHDPEPKGIVSSLIPHQAGRRVIDAVFRWDPYPDVDPKDRPQHASPRRIALSRHNPYAHWWPV